MNKEKLEVYLDEYKRRFHEFIWPKEKYKWQAVKHFQDHWDIEAKNFAEMWMEATALAGNLLTSRNFFPRTGLREFAEIREEQVREAFILLFNESLDLVKRIDTFIEKMDVLNSELAEQLPRKGSTHYQTQNAISTYLWLRYPDRYYIYKYSEVKKGSELLESEVKPIWGGKGNAVLAGQELYNPVREVLLADPDCRQMLDDVLDESCYPDPELITMTTDFFYALGTYLKENEEDEEKDDQQIVIEDLEETEAVIEAAESYTRAEFLDEVYMEAENYDELVELLRYKKNVILQGPPGTGKTFAARRLAYSMIGAKAQEQVELVQFHQSYGYEEFIMGYKPVGEGFELQEGVFYRFCKKAEADPGEDYYFIIDEINRGNLSKIFGELLMLIENSYRGPEHEVMLAYKQEAFYVPENVYIIGTMNTADRSLALIDYALRRRFSFYDMEPGFGTEGFRAYVEELENGSMESLVHRLVALNDTITKDVTLGAGFCIGHSYLCNHNGEGDTEAWLRSIVNYELVPMLREYWFDDSEKAEQEAEQLRQVLDA